MGIMYPSTVPAYFQSVLFGCSVNRSQIEIAPWSHILELFEPVCSSQRYGAGDTECMTILL